MEVIPKLDKVTNNCLLVDIVAGQEASNDRRFPDDFVLGAATASYQIEGAWDEDGKGVNNWDHYSHAYPELIKDHSTGDIAADSYHQYKRDVKMCRELGLDMYRFSISWSRILPNGLANEINQLGVDYYNNLIDELLKYNITPMVTIFHWDLPQNLQYMGGFTNPLIVEWFEDYARLLYKLFGDRVKYWITFNEPISICYAGYGSSLKAPFLDVFMNASGISDYLCAKNLVIAHGRAYRIYVEEFKASQGGVCGITLYVESNIPATNSEEDQYAAMIQKQFYYGIYAHPIFGKEGGFPKEVYARIAEKSAKQGYPRSRLPDFTEDEKKMLIGASDFLGINQYTGYMISATDHIQENPVPSMFDDIGVGFYSLDEWEPSASSWFKKVPNSLYDSLKSLAEEYDNPIMYITENGWSSHPEDGLLDDDRVLYYREKLNECLDVIEAGVNLKGYMAWSLMDNFEWQNGYTERFGIYHVNFTDPTRPRTPRKSAYVYKEILRTRTIDTHYEPDMTKDIAIDEGH